MSLPVELLEIIFEFCYLGCRQKVYDYYWGTPSLSDTLRNFPYNLAAVDPSWNAILLRYRNYWTGLPHLVFNVDSKTPTQIDDAKTLLRYILDDPSLQFHVAIVRHSKENPDGATEKDLVKNLMDLLAPEVHRFRSFLVDVHASSSLPSVTTYFNNLITSCIASFEYLCDIDDSDDTVSEPYEPFNYDVVTWMRGSRITSMILDGGTFRKNTKWLRQHTNLESLTISHISQGATNSADRDVQRALEVVLSIATTQPWSSPSGLKCLKFRDINFAPCYSMCKAFSIFMHAPCNISFQHISFEDVDPYFLEQLTRSLLQDANRDLTDPPSPELHLTCGASSRDIPVDIRRWKYTRLILEGYDEAHLTASYPFDEHCLLSSELHFINCPGFNDAALDILSKISPETKNPLFSANLKGLKLTDCRSFTIQALKDMVTARAMNLQRHSRMPGWKNRRLNSLEVSGYGTPLTDKDEYWFRTHLKNFSWDGALFDAFLINSHHRLINPRFFIRFDPTP
jgi:hypothetical protein